MKMAFFIDEKMQLEAKKTKDWICQIVLYPKGEDNPLIPVNKKLFSLEKLKYAAYFNGKSFVFNVGEILYLESYYRKTSVMIKEGRMRIKARLNEEDGKLPKEWFIRISRHNIVNMQHVNSVKGDEIEMINGDILYIGHNRRKEFGRDYREFLKLNDILV